MIPAYIGPGAGIAFIGSFLILLLALLLSFVSLLTWPIRVLILSFRRWRRGIRGKVDRIVVVGLDGLDPGRVRTLMSAGRLPNFKALADTGTFSDLQTTLPPISPVAWSTFMTGVNPGKHNIFDFLNRDLRTYLPELSSARVTGPGRWRWLAQLGFSDGPVRALRKSQPFWNVLGQYGIFSTILRVPISFPPERFHGLSLSAMCAPDLRGTQGSHTLYSTDETECAGVSDGTRVLVKLVENQFRDLLSGPPHPSETSGKTLAVPFRLEVDPSRNSARLSIDKQVIPLKLREYSPWVRVTFKAGLFTSVRGICQFRLEQITPHVRLYVTPINIDPERPALPISHPLYYSIYLAKLHDSFATLGLAEDTSALNTGAIDDEAFLEQAWSIHAEREAMFFEALRRTRRGLCTCVFDASDRIQHMFYRYTSPDHPCRPEEGQERLASTIDEMYERMDDLVGRVRKSLDDQTLLIVLSDHGFCDFSRCVHLNAWLRNEGYLVLQSDSSAGDYLAGIDWSKTRAYAFGLAGIYLNQAGRENQGIVCEGEAPALKAEISSKLEELFDQARDNRPVVRKVHDAGTAYAGPYSGNGPDLVIGYHAGYRASWETVVGHTTGEVLSDNVRKWSGDHCVDPDVVPGVLFLNRPINNPSPSIMDLAPTILDLFGVPVPSYMDGVVLDFATAASTASASA